MSRFEYPPQLHCALLPTRIERLVRYGESLRDIEVWIKRDDQTGFLLSGNKVRKLEFTFARALADGVSGVITCGGFDSNHCRATTYLAARLGLEAHLLLRTPDGKPPALLQGNTLLDLIAGARVHWVTPEEYGERAQRMEDLAHAAARGGTPLHVIPEGASDAIGAMGFVKAVEELEDQLTAKNLTMDAVVHAMGSGGTTAGLLAGRELHGAKWRLVGVPVCDDEATFRRIVAGIRNDLGRFGLATREDPMAGNAVEALQVDEALEVVEGYQGRGYGLTTPEELLWIRDFCRLEGILLDPTYTGKAFYGLHQEILAGKYPPGSRILFWHTGGTFGNFTQASEWATVLGGEISG